MPTGFYKHKPNSEKQNQNISNSKKGNLTWNKGKKLTPLSESHRTKISNSKKGIPSQLRGEKSNLWKGGISDTPYPVDWTITLRRNIRERDKHICQVCFIPQKKKAHSVHHIDYIKENCDTNNLVTLCSSCHTKTNSNRKYWTNFFKTKLGKRELYTSLESGKEVDTPIFPATSQA